MKITRLQVDGFGVWTGLQVENINDRMTVFYGRNEAGKTTLMQYIRTMLYGFPEERRERYLPPVFGGKPGGEVSADALGGKYILKRHSGGREEDPFTGDLTITANDGAVQGAHFVSTLTSGIDESIFNNVFAVGLRELQELSTLDSTEAADQLYKLTSGLDRVSLVDVARELQQSRERIMADEGKSSLIVELLDRHDKLRREIDGHASRGQRWGRLASQRQGLEEEVETFEQQIAVVEHRVRIVEMSQAVRDKWEDRADCMEQLAGIPRLPEMPERGVEKLEALNARIETRREKVTSLKRQIENVRAEGTALPINRQLWANVSRIDALNEHASWIASLQSQAERLEADVAVMEVELQTTCGDLGLGEGVTSSSVPEISRNALGALKSPARAIRDEQQRLSQSKQDFDLTKREAEEIGLELDANLAEMGRGTLEEALQEAGGRVTKFRRRIHLEERIEKMMRSRNELEEESHELLEEQVLPFWQLAALGIPFVLGAVMVLGGMVWSVGQSVGVGLAVALIGIIGLGVVIAFKMMMERATARELDDCNRQLDLLSRQLKSARDERVTLDEELPPGGGALDNRLANAETDLARLEDLIPVDSRREAAWLRHKAAGDRLETAKESLSGAKEQWRISLRRNNLPSTLSPKHVKQLFERYEHIAQMRLRRDARNDELAQRQRELQSVTGRIGQLMHDVGVKPVTDDPHAQLKQLTDAQADQQQHINRRDHYKKQLRTLRRDLHRYSRSIESLEIRRNAMLAEVGAENEEAYEQIAKMHNKVHKLAVTRDRLSAEITERLGSTVEEDEVANVFEGSGARHLERRWTELMGELEDTQGKLAALHERRGEYTAEMKMLVGDRQLAQAKLELGCVEQQLERAVADWQVLAATGVVMESIREIYEKERQPETLGAATRHLNQLTGGKYKRIWTPLGENALRVDDEHGRALPLEVLSQGTREAVFLSIRLALVSAYARRGAVLPVVLDDVLVNLDTDRARLAGKMLKDFANKGHQLLLFTCHEHIKEMFESISVEVRTLPSRGESGVITAPVLATKKKKKKKKEIEAVIEPTVDASAGDPSLELTPVIELPIVQADPEPASEEDVNLALELAAEPIEYEPLVIHEPEPEPAPEPVIYDDSEYSLAPPVPVEHVEELNLVDEAPEPEPEPYIAPEPEPVALPETVEIDWHQYVDPLEAAEEPGPRVFEQFTPVTVEPAATSADSMWWDGEKRS